MSVTWYECKVKYRKMSDSGEQKMVTEPFLVDAISFTEAETRINSEMEAYVSEEFFITNIKVANFAEIHPFENSDRWFKSKVSLISYDEESGKERKSNMYLLVQGNDVKEAFDNTNTAMKGTMGDYTIPAISESPIMDVFPYFTGEEKQLERFKSLRGPVGEEQELTTVEDAVIEDVVVEDTVVEDTVVEDTVVEDTVVEDTVVEDTVVEEQQ